MKKVQIGARVSEADAEFLNLLEINGAHSPSDKLRAIIQEARQRREYSRDFPGAYRMMMEQLGPAGEILRNAEFKTGNSSVMLARILEWMPNFHAYCISPPEDDGEMADDELIQYEQGAVDRVVRLVESLLHLELSSQETSYTPDVLRRYVGDLEKLIQIIQLDSRKKEG
jgi:hypothetical protein